MWFKNIKEMGKKRKRWTFSLITGVILTTILVFSIILTYKKESLPKPGDFMKKGWMPVHQDYMEIKILFLNESFPGGQISLKIDFENYAIEYNPRMRYDIIRGMEPLVGDFTENEKEQLLLLLEEYKALEWLNGRFYWDLSWHPENCNVTDYTLNPDANAAKRTDFISLNKTKEYLGMGEDEFWLRTERYWGELRYISYFPDSYLYQEYTAYGVPDGYDELLDSLWDFALSKVDAGDWRSIMDQGSLAEMLKEFPYMGKETAGIPDSNKMWYFSINEFFGGKEHGPGAAFVYSRTDPLRTRNNPNYPQKQDKIKYDTWYDANLNLVDTVGNIQTYRETDEWYANKWTETENVMPFDIDDLNEEGKRKLAEILEKYQVTAWREPEYYQNQPEPCHIKEGDFFNLSPDGQYEGISAQELEIRSTFETFIYLYDTDGKRLRLHYDNTGLPENYNEFRDELWNFLMEYRMKRGYFLTMEQFEESDWRNQLDKWGRDHMKIMREKSEEGSGTD